MDIETLYHDFPHRRDLTLEPFQKFLAAIGNPHESLPPVIHVAGTNGKGSTIAMLRACFECAGYQVHAYTSPHLISVTERLCIGSKQIDCEVLQKTLEKFYDLAQSHTLSWFEYLTGVFFHLACKMPADIVLLETGLGGEFDATNVIQKPLVSVITPVSFDHQDMLGQDLATIAKAKAGIIKPKCPVISHPQPPEVMTVIKDSAFKKGSSFSVADAYAKTNLRGRHQEQNAGVVQAVMTSIQKAFHSQDDQIKRGLMTVNWPGRLELVKQTSTQTIYFDVAHNDASVEVAMHFFDTLNKSKAIVFALPKTKDFKQVCRHMSGHCDHVYVMDIPGSKFHNSQDLITELTSLGQSASGLHKDSLISHSQVLVLGSHYLREKIDDLLSKFSDEVICLLSK